MKTWFLGIALVIALAGGSAFNALIYQDTQGKLAVEQQKVLALSEDMHTVSSDLSDLQSSLDSLQGSLGSLEGSLGELSQDITGLNSGVSGLNSKVSALESTASSLGNDFSGLKTSISGINSSISSANGSINNIQGSVSNLQGSVSNLQGNVSSLQGNVSNLQGSLTGLKDSVNSLQASQVNVVDVVCKLEPSVVKIICVCTGYYSGGSGVIVRADGYVLTNYHVIEGSQSISVTLSSGEILRANIVAKDAARDLAVLKLDSSKKDFPAASLGSSASCNTGDEVIAMGFPLLFDQEMSGQATFTSGIVSAKRSFGGYGWIQTDAAINHGNSGGPLVNMKSEVIGINSMRVFEDDTGNPIDNIGFAIPIDDAKALIVSVAGAA